MTVNAPPSIRYSKWFCFALVFAVLGVGQLSAQDAVEDDTRRAAELLPGTVVAYAEVPQLGDVIEMLSEHPLRNTIQAMPVVQAVANSDQLRPLRDGLAAFEGGMGRPWKESLSVLTNGGIHLAFDAPTQGAALLIKSSSRDQLDRFQGVVLALSQLSQGNVGIAKPAEYRGFKAYSLNDNAKMAIVNNWLLLTNKAELGKSIIDRYLDGDNDSLDASEQFALSMEKLGSASLKAYVDLETIRSAGVAPKLYAGKTDNVAAEALFGGVVANLAHAPSAVASLTIVESGVELTLATPHESEWESGREYFFGEDSDAAAPLLLKVPGQILAISTHRDLSQMWLRAPDLMTDKANEDLAQADTNLTTFFSGRDFGQDILGSLFPGIQLVVNRQSFDDQSVKPAIKLPAFAMQFRMRTPEETTREFRRVFQNVIGFINVVGAMQGQPQLDLDFEQSDATTLVTATYVPPRDEQEQAFAPINFNFSPTIAFLGDRMVISSTSELARTLSRTSPDLDSSVGQPNTIVVLQADALVETLNDNKQQLVAQNMLEKGHGPDQANAEIGLLFEILGLFQDASVDLDVDGGQLKLSAEVRLKTK